MQFTLYAEELRPVLRKAWVTVAVFAGVGASAQIPLLFVGFGPVLWSNFLGAGALALALWLGRQTWRRTQAGPRLDVALDGKVLSTHWAGEDSEAVAVGPDSKVSERMGWFVVQSGGGAVVIPLALPGLKELKDAVGKARFGDRARELRRPESLPPANDRVTPDPQSVGGRLDTVARIFAFASLGTLALTVAGGLLIGFDAGMPLFGLFLASAGAFLFIEKGLVPLKTKRITQSTRYTGPTETRGTMAQLIGGLNLVGSVLLALLGVLLFIIGVGAQLS